MDFKVKWNYFFQKSSLFLEESVLGFGFYTNKTRLSRHFKVTLEKNAHFVFPPWSPFLENNHFPNALE